MISGLGIEANDVLGIIPAPLGHSASSMMPQNWRRGVAPSRFPALHLAHAFPGLRSLCR